MTTKIKETPELISYKIEQLTKAIHELTDKLEQVPTRVEFVQLQGEVGELKKQRNSAVAVIILAVFGAILRLVIAG